MRKKRIVRYMIEIESMTENMEKLVEGFLLLSIKGQQQYLEMKGRNRTKIYITKMLNGSIKP
jgi:hypothetical protein